jgi:hydroxymethylpyrimidine pyrophosphatase-like HAD family hydrolase
MSIRLLVFDIDGVLTDGEAQALDLSLLARLAAMNRAARQDSVYPAVTLCTGRPAPYVELMLQAIDGHLPAVFENGAGLYLPDGYRFLPHPELGNSAVMPAVHHRLEQTLTRAGLAYFQPGKIYSLTLFATDPAETFTLHSRTADALGELNDHVELVYSSSCLNILPRGIHKGKGLSFLARQTGYQTADMLGVGDSDVDVPFLPLVGYSAAPANANAAVRQLVHYVAPRPTSAGVGDILEHFGLLPPPDSALLQRFQ